VKRIIALLIALLMVCSLVPAAFAAEEGTFTVIDSNWFVYDNGKDGKFDVWFFAEVRNDNGFSLYFKEGSLTVTDASGKQFGDPIKLSSGDISFNTLAPGETGIIFKYTTLKDVSSADEISNVVFSAAGKQYDTHVIPLKAEAEMSVKLDNSPTYGGEYYKLRIDTTVSHDYDYPVYQPTVNVTVYDQNGKLIFAKRENDGNISVLPGNAVMIHSWTNAAKLGRVWAENGIVPTTCKVTAFAAEGVQSDVAD